jgi:tetratricopeptide (TPR) repeat protein
MSFRYFCGSIIFYLLFATPSYAADLVDLQARATQASGQQVAQLLQELEAVLARTPEHYAALFLKARLLQKAERRDEAEKVYQRLIEINPSRPEAYNNLAVLRVAAGDMAGAQSFLEKAIRANPSYATVYDNLSQIYVAMARDSYGKALRLETEQKAVALTQLTELSDPLLTGQAQLIAATKTESEESADIQISLVTKPEQAKPEETRSVQPSSAQYISSDSGVSQVVTTQSEPAETLVAKMTTQQGAGFEEEIITTLEGWAAAWSEQATDVYFVFYADDYHPQGQTRSSWKKERRVRIAKPRWIQVALKDIEVRPINTKEVKVELTQIYKASNYQDKTRKEFMMQQTADGWRIVVERSLARID